MELTRLCLAPLTDGQMRVSGKKASQIWIYRNDQTPVRKNLIATSQLPIDFGNGFFRASVRTGILLAVERDRQ